MEASWSQQSGRGVGDEWDDLGGQIKQREKK